MASCSMIPSSKLLDATKFAIGIVTHEPAPKTRVKWYKGIWSLLGRKILLACWSATNVEFRAQWRNTSVDCTRRELGRSSARKLQTILKNWNHAVQFPVWTKVTSCEALHCQTHLHEIKCNMNLPTTNLDISAKAFRFLIEMSKSNQLIPFRKNLNKDLTNSNTIKPLPNTIVEGKGYITKYLKTIDKRIFLKKDQVNSFVEQRNCTQFFCNEQVVWLGSLRALAIYQVDKQSN